MRTELLEYIACPKCAADLQVEPDERDGDEIMTGRLTCEGCQTAYPIVHGVPRLNVDMEGLEQVQDTFSYEWSSYHEGTLEGRDDDSLFGQSKEQDWTYFLEATGLTEERLAGKVALDGGCGSGRLTRQIGEHAGTVIGVDINEAVGAAFDYTRDLPNVHIVQGNILRLPFKERRFDLVWSHGVIHHTPDAAGGHRALSRLVKPGGTLYVWVYHRRLSPFDLTKDVLDFLRVTKLPQPALMGLSKAFSYASIPMLKTYQLARRVPGLEPKSAWAKRTLRDRTVKELQITWFDALAPEWDTRHTVDEVVGWFRREGFDDIHAIEDPKVGVRGIAPATARAAADGNGASSSS